MEVENNVMAEAGKGSRKGEASSERMRLGREVGPHTRRRSLGRNLGLLNSDQCLFSCPLAG